MTADTRLSFISPEDGAKTNPVLFNYTRAQHLCLLIDLISASSTQREQTVVFIPGNSEATPPL